MRTAQVTEATDQYSETGGSMLIACGQRSPDTVASTLARSCAWKAAPSGTATDTIVGCVKALPAAGSCLSTVAGLVPTMKAARLEAVG